MDEARLRELATELRDQLPTVITDEQARRGAAGELDTALALPRGTATKALRTTLSARPETRDWMREHLDEDANDEELGDRRDDLGGSTRAPGSSDRGVSGLPGQTTGLGVHFVCPQGDYDVYVERLADDPGRCPFDRSTLVRADD